MSSDVLETRKWVANRLRAGCLRDLGVRHPDGMMRHFLITLTANCCGDDGTGRADDMERWEALQAERLGFTIEELDAFCAKAEGKHAGTVAGMLMRC